ncbi:hypothetical protein Avbf_11304 [Armadillidium vulgare]|nr:hypothetical protein Avbf_11304 [Armadillidium vulgare]
MMRARGKRKKKYDADSFDTPVVRGSTGRVAGENLQAYLFSFQNGEELLLEEKKSSCLEAEPEPNIELQNGQELSLEEKKSSCLEAEPKPNIELQNGQGSSLEEKKSSCSEAEPKPEPEPNIELQVDDCQRTNDSLKDELNLKIETMNGQGSSLEEKKSSCLEAEPEPNGELQVDKCQGPKCRLKKAFKLKIKTMVKRQIDRHPSQVVLVHDKSWKPFITKELESSVKVFNCGISNFENIMKFLKGHKILGKGSLLILMIGTYSLIREESPSICKSLKCKNQPVMRYIIPNMKSDNVISQVLSLQENLLDSTDIDQVMLCDIIPVYVDQKVMKCSNKHSSRNVMHADLYSKYLKEIEIFNDFVDIHCRSFQFENLSLLKKILPTNCNRDQNWFSSFSIADVQPRLSDFIASKIEEIAKNIQNSSKTSNRTDLIHCQEIQQERDSSFLNLKSDNENDDDDVVIIDVIPSTSNAQISTRKAEENSSILPQAEASTTSKTCNISEASTLEKHANMMKTSVLETTPSSKSDFSNKKTNATGEVTSSKFPDHSTETQSSASKVSTLVENGTDKSFITPSGKKGITCITNSTPAKSVQNISTEKGSNTKNLISIPLAKKPLPPVNIITSSANSECVVIRNNKFDSFDDIIPLIKKEQELHSKKTLFILFTGLLNIAKKDSYKCQRIMKGLRLE